MARHSSIVARIRQASLVRPGLQALLLGWGLIGATAARAEVLTLGEVERRALSDGPLQAAAARTNELEAELDVVRSGRRPVVALVTDASLAPGGQLFEVEGTNGQRFLVQGSRRLGESGSFTPLPRFGGVLSLQANVFDFGRTASRIRAAEHRAHGTWIEEQAARADALRLAREAFLAWVVAYARSGLAEQHLRDGRARFDALQGLVKEGTNATGDVNVAEQEWIALDIELSGARAAAERARLALAGLLTGALAASVVPDLAILEAPFVDGSPIEDQDLAAAALEQQAKAAVAAADSLVHVHAPVISASAEAGLRGQASNVFPAYRAGVTITVPLWDGGLGAAQARAAEAGASALHAAADASSRARHSERLVARSDGARAEEKLRLAERLKKLAEEELGQVGERYRLGDVDLRVVLDARAHLSRAEGQVLAAKTERAQAALRARS